MKIYTKTGDDGTTLLCNGKRVPKNSIRVCAHGDIDELNSSIGLAISFSKDENLKNILQDIQRDLFLLSSYISLCDKKLPKFDNSKIAKLELIIDETNALLMPLENFIIPGGTTLASTLHLARTICRRAERTCIDLAKNEDIFKLAIPYLNRLSDLLFILARKANNDIDIIV